MSKVQFSPSPYPEGKGWDRVRNLCIYIWWVGGWVGSTVISSSSSSPSSLEEGSSWTYVEAVPRDLLLYEVMSWIR